MATYKVIQDIEAEDKLIGPLTLRQFIYAAISAVCLYISFIAITKHFPVALVFFLPVALISGFFAFPWKGEQPTEVWALAKIRFFLKPRRRIWDQSGIKELVTVTAPRREIIDYTKGLSQNEVRSRLRALADTIDSRGWAVKNANLNLYTQPALVMTEPTTDRLLGPSAFPQRAEAADVRAADDILDEVNNPRAKQVNSMIEASAKAHRQKIMDSLHGAPPEPAKEQAPAQAPANNYWFLNQPSPSASVPGNAVTFNTQVVTPGMTEQEGPANTEERRLVQELEARKRELPMTAYYGHLHTIQPISQQGTPQPPQAPQAAAPAPQASQPAAARPQTGQTQQPAKPGQPAVQAQAPVTPKQQAAILQLANNDDLNVATLAREAQRSGEANEVIIKLR